MRAHYFQHVPFEGLGSIEEWLQAKQFHLTATRFYENTALPELQAVDFLIVMGGPMSVNDEVQHPWLTAEKQFIQQMILAGKPVLGICLGAQLIASAMGARVYPNPDKEIGWWPIYSVANGNNDVFRFPPVTSVFHWHGETFDLSDGAIRLAESAGCGNQAFQLGHTVVGMQFHLETTEISAQAIIHHCGDELTAAPYVQTEHAILAAEPNQYRNINQLMVAVLDYLHTAAIKAKHRQ